MMAPSTAMETKLMAAAPFRIVEAIFPGMTQLDFTGPDTVFSRLPDCETIVALRRAAKIEFIGGLFFAGTARLAEIDRCDLIFFPGGLRHHRGDQRRGVHGRGDAAGGRRRAT